MPKKRPTSLDDLREIGLRERDALIVAATLPYIPDGDFFVRVRHGQNFFETPKWVISDFVDSAPLLGGTANVRRVSKILTEYTDTEQAKVTPEPHGVTNYTLSLNDVDLITKSADGYEWDTDQSLLSNWNVTSPVLYKHGNSIPDGYDFPRKPTLPTYTP